MRKLILAGLRTLILMAVTVWGYRGGLPARDLPASRTRLKVGIFVDGRSVAVMEITRALEEKGLPAAAGAAQAGIEVGTFTKKDASAGKFYDYDVLFFGGGHHEYDWLSLAARMHVVEYVQQRGGGAIFSFGRCGCTNRSILRPLFPEIAYAHARVRGTGIIVQDKHHPITEGLPERFLTPYWDHGVLELGTDGKALTIDTRSCCQSSRGA